MRHPIDPKVDCVFKALLGAEENANLLVNFINAIIGDALEYPIVAVEILNPYNEKETLDDKTTIVDVKAKDSRQQLYQIEIQLAVENSLLARIFYTWADIYSGQLKSGENFNKLKPTYSIWLINNKLINDNRYLHEYHFKDQEGNIPIPHGGVWVLELKKFSAAVIENDKQRWLTFFKEGADLDDKALPQWMQTNEMRQAMKTLKTFSEKDREYDKYQARQNFLRVQSCEREEKEEALKKAAEAQKREAVALARIEELEALLAKQNNVDDS